MSVTITTIEINDWLLKSFPHVVVKKKYGETTYFYNKDDALPHGIYFLTIKEADGPNDSASKLNRPGVFRVSWQLEPSEFEKNFGRSPPRPAKGESIQSQFNLAALDTHLPHAVYGWMGWSMLLSPSPRQFELQKASIRGAYERALDKFEKKVKGY